VDFSFVVIVAGGAALLVGAVVQSRRARRARAVRLGHEVYGDVSHLPAALQDTVLWRVTEGGREREVTAADVEVDGAAAEVTTFVLDPLRELRAEWGYVPIDPPFRVRGPIAVAAVVVPHELPRLLLRRTGPSDDVGARRSDYEAIGAPLRAISGIPSALPADLPPALAGPTVALAEDWRGVAEPAAAAALAALPGVLEPRARGLDLMIESCGALVLAADVSGELPDDDGFAALVELARTAAAMLRHG
jgi:hypothetical protein